MADEERVSHEKKDLAVNKVNGQMPSEDKGVESKTLLPQGLPQKVLTAPASNIAGAERVLS